MAKRKSHFPSPDITAGLVFLALASILASPSGIVLADDALPAPGILVPRATAAGDDAIAPAAEGFQAFNRAHGLNLHFTATGGVRLVPDAADFPWAAGLVLQGFGPKDAVQPVILDRTAVGGSRIEQTFGSLLSAWYLNTEEGLIQGFRLAGPSGHSAGGENLDLHQIDILLEAAGAEIRAVADDSIVFVTPGGREVLRYSLVGATDPTGAPVPVKMALVHRPEDPRPLLQLVAVVDPGQVLYPVEIQLRLGTSDLKAGAGPGTSAPEQTFFAPAEDTCSGAQVIPAGTYPVLSTTVNNSTATDSGDPTNTCQSNSHLGLWYSFTPTTNDTYIVTTCKNKAPGTTRSDTVLAVFTSASGCGGALTQVSCNDDDSGCTGYTYQSRTTFTATPGTTYYILAYSYGTTGGDIQIQIDKQQPPPANDTCAGAVAIPGGGPWPLLTTPQDNTLATSTNDPNATCSTSEALGIWYTFTPDVSGQYYITTCQNMAPGAARQDTVLSIFTSASGCAGAFTEVASGCNDNNTECEGHSSQSVIQPTLTAGTTYYILAYNYGTTTFGNIQLYVEPSPAAPPNDLCSGAQVIPGGGPFPYLTTTVDITNATTTGGDPTIWSCTTAGHVAWYEFTPAASGSYSFTTCKNAAAGTTCLDTVMAVYTSSTNACGGTYTQVSGACNDNDSGCSGAANLSTLSLTMTAGQKYYLLVGSPGITVPQPGKVQVQVTFIPPPGNDTCSAPTPLAAGLPLAGTTAGAFNDYQLSSASPTCFTLPGTPLNQTASTAPGRDVVYSFTPATSGNYSCRVYSYNTTQNLVLHVAGSCPAATPGTPVTIANPPCVGASNRSTSSWQEEVACIPMTGGQPYFVFVDDNVSGNAGSAFFVKCTPCNRETESNNTPATANPFLCGILGSINPAGDVDFFQIPGAGTSSRLFVLADGGATGSNDFDLRVTSPADTLQYNDADADAPYGGLSATVDGVTLANGPPYYLRMSYYSTGTAAEPYRLYLAVEPPPASAVPETETNDTPAQANANAMNYFKGTMSAVTDADWFSFTANAGDVIFAGLDCDPNYDGTANNLALTLYDSTGTAILVTVNGGSSTTATLNRPLSAGNLAATTPVAPGEALEWNAHYTGTYYLKVTTSSGSGQEYLLAIMKNCQGEGSDFAVTKNDSPDPVATGQNLTYTVVVTNNGPGAGGATMSDPLPAGTTFVSVSATGGWSCSSPPVGGTGTVSCNGSLSSGSSATITIVVKVDWCWGNTTISNTATVTASGTDTNPGNDSSSASTTVTDDGSCSDTDACTTGDYCDAGVCQSGTPTNCDDSDICTTDACNTTSGACEHTAVACDDGNPCTDDACVSPAQGCTYTPDDTNSCSDGSLCTTDACVGGACVGTPAVFCNDGEQCTADACNPATGLCDFVPTPGASCDDGNECSTSDACGCSPGATLAENFDAVTLPALPPGWTTQLITGLTGDKAWESTAAFFDTAPNSAYTDDPTHVTDKVLVSPPFLGLGGAAVSFMNRYDLEKASSGTTAYDGAVLEIKVGTGAWQDIIAAGGVWVSGGYDTTVATSFSNPLAGRAAWSGTSSGFVPTAVTLPAGVTGETVQLRWRVGTDTSAGKTGQWIDSIVIPVCNIGCGGTPVPDGTSCDDGTSCTTADACAAGVCVGGPAPPETCNGLDDDCDGTVDDGNPGGGGRCGTSNIGECSTGLDACVGGGIQCQGSVAPRTEDCDGLDNDCDGFFDNACTPLTCNVRLPLEAKTGHGEDFIVPIVVESATGALGMNFSFSYDPALLTPTAVYTTALTTDFELVYNLGAPGLVQISLYSGTPLTGGGSVAEVVFHTTGSALGPTPLHWTLAEINEGAIPGSTCDGVVTLVPTQAVLSLPDDICGAPGSVVPVPVTATPADGMISADLIVEFNPLLFQVMNVTTTSYTAGYSVYYNPSTAGKVLISFYGEAPLSGSGPLVNIHFLVLGTVGEASPLNLTKSEVNEGALLTTNDDGLFTFAEDGDLDGFTVCNDCDDANPDVYPGAPEICDLIDNQCPGDPGYGQIDEGVLITYYRDLDADAYGDPAVAQLGCTPPPGYVPDNTDCDDTDHHINPGAGDESCDNVDQNCSGVADEEYVSIPTTCGIGACAATGSTSCVGGAVVDNCVPGTPSPETCNGIDDDCDGTVDNPSAPAGKPALLVVRSGAQADLSWSVDPQATGYDLVQGSLAALVAGSGDFSGATGACLADDQSGSTFSDSGLPAAGDILWYLVRPVNCGGSGTYNDDGTRLHHDRDPDIGASPNACP